VDFAKRLKKLRMESGLTQKELAKKIGVSRATVAGYETKGKEPSYDTLIKIAKALNCSLDYLTGNTNKRSPIDEILNYDTDDPELQEIIDELSKGDKREQLRVVMQKTKNLTDEDIELVLNLIKSIEK